jgi:hypothetical protein
VGINENARRYVEFEVMSDCADMPKNTRLDVSPYMLADNDIAPRALPFCLP